jgi:Kef-type K+ transport system membrane component KefB/mannitol/fructose-specific phosphotransferase system IIA component (Ntr-type)
MGELHSSDLTVLFLGLAVLLAAANAFGEIARRLGQPAVIGEMVAGLLLGPTFLGWISPEFQAWLFPHHTAAAAGRDAIVALAVALLLLIAGMEVDLSSVWRQGRSALLIAIAGLLVPLGVGGLLATFAPDWWGMPEGGNPTLFAIFFGTALSVSALPVIAKILLELDLAQTDFGMLALVAATVNNLLSWLIFSVVLGGREGGGSLGWTVVLTVGFALVVLTLGRWTADRVLPWVQAHLPWPGGVLGFLLIAGLLGAALTEAIGIHAIFGAFLVGIALGDSQHLREHTRHIVQRFVEGVLAPIFVAAIGLEVNFAANFHVWLVIRVLALGIVVKVLGCSLAARLGGLPMAESKAIGWALNARGELGILLGLLAWNAGLIRERLFVALVTLAVATSAMTGPAIKRLLRRGKSWSLATTTDARLCVLDLDASDSTDAIRKLSAIAAERAVLDPGWVANAVLRREALMSTGIGNGMAVPHARLLNLNAPLVVIGQSRRGLDFDAPDAELVRLVFLILTPRDDQGAQLQILGSIARLVRDPQVREELFAARTPLSLLAALRVADVLHKEPQATAAPKVDGTTSTVTTS